jgi:hypothetical protein
VRVLTTYWSNPRSFSAATESGELDPDEREVLDCLHPDVRWRNVIGEIREGKLGCARGLDELLRASQAAPRVLAHERRENRKAKGRCEWSSTADSKLRVFSQFGDESGRRPGVASPSMPTRPRS